MLNLSAEDKIFIKHLKDMENAAVKYKSPQFSKFFDPHLRNVFHSLPRSVLVNTMTFGGKTECEREVAGFFPDFYEPCSNDFPITAIKINKIGENGHREVLGSMLGLSIKRELIGDIIIDEESAYIFCLTSIADYITLNLKRIGREKVTAEEIDILTVPDKTEQFKDISGTVMSLRLDSVISLATGQSRSKSSELISKGLVRVNHEENINQSSSVKEKDLIAIKGFGRFIVYEIQGLSKKGRTVVNLRKFV